MTLSGTKARATARTRVNNPPYRRKKRGAKVGHPYSSNSPKEGGCGAESVPSCCGRIDCWLKCLWDCAGDSSGAGVPRKARNDTSKTRTKTKTRARARTRARVNNPTLSPQKARREGGAPVLLIFTHTSPIRQQKADEGHL